VEKQNKTCFNFEFPERSLSSIVIKDNASEWKNKIKLVLMTYAQKRIKCYDCEGKLCEFKTF
jgi:hypothetical protein